MRHTLLFPTCSENLLCNLAKTMIISHFISQFLLYLFLLICAFISIVKPFDCYYGKALNKIYVFIVIITIITVSCTKVHMQTKLHIVVLNKLLIIFFCSDLVWRHSTL